MERFVVIQTVTDCALAERLCAALEESEIPVMLEHVELSDEGIRVTGYRVLAPSNLSQRATVLAARIAERRMKAPVEQFSAISRSSQKGWAGGEVIN